ncbi:hypothetical protein PL321_03515 [Caloramator sp. mosi_1]|uniref:hypothetical protein n=1 Tax=Caloramator sp. mosi_1 TaxID=3023090 RepID=UPI00235DC7F9|nr:hypothetical protein [Caloramator sp. mosi_1]WDC84732.1 hypothetical protein PL321_03515 [Caloramator sp. mosi_1]
MQNEIKNLSKQLNVQKEITSQYIAMDLIKDSKENIIFKIYDDKLFDEIQMIGNKLTSLCDKVVILASIADKKLY